MKVGRELLHEDGRGEVWQCLTVRFGLGGLERCPTELLRTLSLRSGPQQHHASISSSSFNTVHRLCLTTPAILE